MASKTVSAVHDLFNNPAMRRLLVRARIPLTLIVAALVIVHIDRRWFWPGIAVSAFGELWQLWCFASLKKQKVLATRGPYVLMRNPMYIARYFLILGGLLLLGHPWIAIPYSVLYYFYMVNRVKREERKLAGIFGEPYAQYCREVNRFLPTLRKQNWGDVLFFDWSLLLGNHGGWNVLGALIFYAAAYLYVFIVV